MFGMPGIAKEDELKHIRRRRSAKTGRKLAPSGNYNSSTPKPGVKPGFFSSVFAPVPLVPDPAGGISRIIYALAPTPAM